MDKVKEALAFSKKHHFWILSGLAFLILFVMYLQASGKLNAEYNTGKKNADAASKSLDPYVSGKDHPNNKWVEAMNKQTTTVRTKSVRDAWEELCANQKGIFVWPAGLGPDFIEAFANPDAVVNPDKMNELCERYQKNVVSELKSLVTSVDAQWTAVEGAAGGAHGARPGMPAGPRGKGPVPGLPAGGLPGAGVPEIEYPVVWRSDDQARLVKDYNWQEAPSALDVRYAQEELWVMQAICDSIARTNIVANGGSRPLGAYQAVVREIDTILAGYDAAGKSAGGMQQQSRLAVPIGAKRIIGPAANPAQPQPGMGGLPAAPDQPFDVKRPDREKRESTPGGGSGFGPGFGGRTPPPGFGGQGGPQGPGMPPGMPGMPGAGEPAGPDDWLNNGRYVDGNGKPLRASDKAPFEEYNLMAFRINVEADEQKWPALLVELCRSKLPLEVREVRLNASSAEAGGGGRGGPGGPGNEGFRPQQGQKSPAANESGFLRNVNVEIVGVVYLLNPVSKELKGDGATGADGAANPAPATAPAPTATAPAGAPAASGATPATAPAPTPPAGAPATGAPATAAPATGAPAVPAPATGAAPPTATTPPGTSPAAPSGPAAPAPAPTSPPAPGNPAGAPPAAGPPAAPAK